MKTRIVSALCMLPLLLIIYLGNGYLGILLLVVLFVSIFEFFKAYNTAIKNDRNDKEKKKNEKTDKKEEGNEEKKNISDEEKNEKEQGIKSKEKNAKKVGYKKFVIYPLFIFFSISCLSAIDLYLPRFTIFLVLVISFMTDIFAYFTGMLIGKHKLAPKISPKKTIEGSIGGIIFSTIFAFLFLFVIFNYGGEAFNVMHNEIISKSIIFSLILGGVGSVVAQLGDLTASYIKRCFKIKDFSNLIPGHGGVLDRIDSVLFVSPFVFFVLYFLIRI